MNEISWLLEPLTTWTAGGAVAVWWLSLWLRNVAARKAQAQPLQVTQRDLLLWGLALASFIAPAASALGGPEAALLEVGKATIVVGLGVALLKLPFLLYRATLIGLSLLEMYLLRPRQDPHQRFRWLAVGLASSAFVGGMFGSWGSVRVFGLAALGGALNVGMAHLVFEAVKTGGPFSKEELS